MKKSFPIVANVAVDGNLIMKLALRGAKRDNPDAETMEIHRIAVQRAAIGSRPTKDIAVSSKRSPTAKDLARAARKRLVRAGRHLR